MFLQTRSKLVSSPAMKCELLPPQFDVSITEKEPNFPFGDTVDYIEDLLESHYGAFNLRLGNVCNQSCLYCNVARDSLSFAGSEDLKAQIERTAELGLDRLAFIGGEPTIRKDLSGLVRFARSNGFQHIMLMTNGLLLSYPEIVDDLATSGVTTVHLSLNDFDPDTMQRLSQNPKADRLIRAALDNLVERHDISLYLYAVVTRWNLGHLSTYVDRVKDLSERRGSPITMILTSMYPVAYGFDHRHELLPRAVETAAVVRDVIRKALRIGVQIAYRDIPPCLMRGYEGFAVDAYFKEICLDLDTGKILPAIRDPLVTKGPDCMDCRLEPHCRGVYQEYVSEAGWSEFRPVRDSAKPGTVYPRKASALDSWYQKNPGRAVVVGGTGFVGSHVTRQLSRTGWEVVSLSRNAAGKDREVSGVEYRLGDRRNSDVIGALLETDPDLWVDLALFEPEEALSLTGSWNSGLNTRFVIAGAVAEYRNGADPPLAYEETMKLSPTGPYGSAKVKAYRKLASVRGQGGFPFVWGVIPQVWGPGSWEIRDRLFVDDILGDRPILLAGNGAELVADGFVGTIAEALLHVAGVKTLQGSRVNLRGPEPITKRLFVETAAAALDREVTLLFVTEEASLWIEKEFGFKERDLLGSGAALPDGRLLVEQGFFPATQALEGIRETALWYAEHPLTAQRESRLSKRDLHRIGRREDVTVVHRIPF